MTRGPEARHPATLRKVWWHWSQRMAMGAFFMLVAWLLVTQARAVEWAQVLAALANYPRPSLLGAVVLTLGSLVLYSAFDLLGRHYTGHALPALAVMRVTFISYVFNLNLGSLVGAVALRYRLYSRLGLDTGTITRVMFLSLLTNWTGYLLLAGVAFGFYTPALPPGWRVGSAGLQNMGFVLLAISLLYLLLCALSRQRRFTLRGHALNLPSLRLAVLQLGMGALNWLLMGGVMFMALQQKVEFSTVVGVLMVAALASIIARVPGGLGVLETVFVVLLLHRLARNELLAAVLVYRLIYYLVPLALASVMYLAVEVRAKKNRAPITRTGRG